RSSRGSGAHPEDEKGGVMTESVPSVRDALTELRASTKRLRVAAAGALSRAGTDASSLVAGLSAGADDTNGTNDSAALGARTHRLLSTLRARRAQVLDAVE